MNEVVFGDCRTSMIDMIGRGDRVQMCVTSPPYFGLRDYGTGTWEGGDPDCDHVGSVERLAPPGTAKQASNRGTVSVRSGDCACGAKRADLQLGLEQTPDEYVAAMVEVFSLVWYLLADDGVLWLNLGDSYAGSGPSGASYRSKTTVARDGKNTDGAFRISKTLGERGLTYAEKKPIPPAGLKPKDLIGIPWRVAFALQEAGWYLRQDIIWHKPNPMPESVTDRCTKAHEYLFLLSKSERYYFDNEAIKEPLACQPHAPGNKKVDASRNDADQMHKIWGADGLRNRRSVWTIATKPYSGAHFATFPPALIEPCILAGSRPGDVVFDPFMGSGTTAQVALQHGRRYLGCELNPDYEQLQKQRISSSNRPEVTR